MWETLLEWYYEELATPNIEPRPIASFYSEEHKCPGCEIPKIREMVAWQINGPGSRLERGIPVILFWPPGKAVSTHDIKVYGEKEVWLHSLLE